MAKNNLIFTLICLLFGLIDNAAASYSFKITVKYPFISEHNEYDSLGNVIIVSDSLARHIAVRPIIFRTEIESLYQESTTNDSGYVDFTFEKWIDDTPVTIDNIVSMNIDFPNTDRVIRIEEQITFEHLIYYEIDFRTRPEEIEIVLPMTVTKDEFIIGNEGWINVFNFAVMNDMHVGEGWFDFGSVGWDDYDNDPDSTNAPIQNDENVVAAINNLSPDFTVVLGDVTDSGERSEFQRARKVLGVLLQKPYIPVIGNHDVWPYYRIPPHYGEEADIPSDCYIGEYFFDNFETMYDSVALVFARWNEAPEFSSSPVYTHLLDSIALGILSGQKLPESGIFLPNPLQTVATLLPEA